MENKHYQNLNLIIDSIEKQAEKEQKLLEEASEKLYTEKYEALKKDIKAKYAKRTEYELSAIALNSNKKASAFESEYKAKLSALRERITDEVYKEAEEAIRHFISGDNYAALLLHSAEKISKLYDGDATVYLKNGDLCHKENIEKAFGKKVNFTDDSTITLGGIKVLFENHSVLVDDTLDTCLEESKKEFIKISDLGAES